MKPQALPPVRRFEPGCYFELITKTLERAGLQYKLVSGFNPASPRYRVGARNKIFTLHDLVDLTNKYRARDGLPLLDKPSAMNIGRRGRRVARVAV